MYPVLFKTGGISIYSYGFMIAVGAIAGTVYLVHRGKKEVGFTFDQANMLFLLLFLAAFIGGKVFLFFEDTGHYLKHPGKLVAGSGFVFYGSFLFAIPAMLWFFRKQKLPVLQMLDMMAITTCLVHMFGRLGCFLAGCCYGKPTDSFVGVIYTSPLCQARPLHTTLYPTQLFESGYIFGVMLFLLYLRDKKTFQGQLFLLYLLLYGAGRFVLEYFRGDAARGFIIENYLSHSQFIALVIVGCVIVVYRRLYRRALTAQQTSK